MKIGLDVEGVLADIHTVVVKRYNELYDDNLTLEDITDWYLENTKFKISSDDFVLMGQDMWKERWREIPLTEENLSQKVQILSGKYGLSVITTRKMTKNEILCWLAMHQIGYTDFIPLDYDPKISGKSVVGCDIFIDDNPLLASEVIERQGRMLLYHRPWNRKVPESRYVTRVRNFEEIIKHLS